MLNPSRPSRWTRHLFDRQVRVRTTWRLRIAVVTLVFFALWLTGGRWSGRIARGLVCEADPVPSDAILIENLESDYLLFERATALRQEGLAVRVLVTARTDPGTHHVNQVALGTVEVMARIARTEPLEIVPIREVEPITLNAAGDVQRFVEREHIRSVILITSQFRSRRSALVYAATLGRAGVRVRCEPVEGTIGVATWTKSWHGIQNVMEQWAKLQYYRFWVLPFRSKPAEGRRASHDNCRSSSAATSIAPPPVFSSARSHALSAVDFASL